ncbi:hypothetical protein [Clostridium sp. AN503]|uniref:hypothetical protein n=1 Tax=Clostridium sp. AN503 TaxID=3160598 RepID=UPI003459B2C0
MRGGIGACWFATIDGASLILRQTAHGKFVRCSTPQCTSIALRSMSVTGFAL